MTQIDPDPTIFGTGRIDPFVSADGSTELSRATEWILNRAERMAFGDQLRTALLGDPIAAYNLEANFQAILDWKNDQLPSPFDDDAEFDDPRSNWASLA